jgi:hypothetical protein
MSTLSLYLGPLLYYIWKKKSLSLTKEQDPIANLLYALKSSESKRQYTRRFKMFLDFLKLEGSLED